MSAKSGTSRMNDDGISAGLLLSKRPPARRNEKPTERTVQHNVNTSNEACIDAAEAEESIETEKLLRKPNFRTSLLRRCWSYQSFLLLLANMFAWSVTNGMNGIAMQDVAMVLQKSSSASSLWLNTCFLTASQLLLGAALGGFMILVHTKLIGGSKRTGSLQFTMPTSTGVHVRGADTFLCLLHCCGNLFNNIGIMYGSASLVQVIKLIEPFETLILSKLILKDNDEGKPLTKGVVAAMALTVGGAISLIQSRPGAPPVLSCAFAFVSGVMICMRNVLQRLQHNNNSVNQQQQQLEQEVSGLEHALVQFTSMSLQSGVLLLSFSILYWLVANETIMRWHVIRVLSWHPLYNLFSMVTLSFCSALTHSLLNAGKRVVAIGMAVIWFKEGLTRQTSFGLIYVTVGGCWYSVESKRRRSRGGWEKMVVCALLLHLLFNLDTYERVLRM
jgi:hypothetical protein